MELIQSINHFRRIPFNMELKGLIISALSFILFPFLIRLVDTTAAAIDPGVLSGILLAIAAVLFFQATTWWVIKAIWPCMAIATGGGCSTARRRWGLNSLLIKNFGGWRGSINCT